VDGYLTSEGYDVSARTSRLAALSPRLRRVTPPTEPLFTLHEARTHLRVELDAEADHPDDDLIKRLVAAVTGELDGWTGWLGRALRPQTWRMDLTGYPSFPLALPLPPLVTVDSVKALNEGGTYDTVSSALYDVLPGEPFSEVALKHGEYWPDLLTSGQRGAVQIQFTCGVATGAEGEPDPPEFEIIRAYASLRLGWLYEHRESMIAGTTFAAMPGLDGMLENVRARYSEAML
jgi:uncharacterized phiE125 gp8 family phage protein